MDILDSRDVAVGLDSPGWFQSKRNYMRVTFDKAKEDRIRAIKSQIATLSDSARRQPEIQDLERRLMLIESKKDRPKLNGVRRGTPPEPYNPYPLASKHGQANGLIKPVGAKVHPLE